MAKLTIVKDLCKGCGLCADVCPKGLLALSKHINARGYHPIAIEEQEKTMKAALYDAMVKFGIKKFESDILNLTLVDPTTSTSIDAAKLKKKYPAIAAECSKSSAKAGYVKITLRGGEK